MAASPRAPPQPTLCTSGGPADAQLSESEQLCSRRLRCRALGRQLARCGLAPPSGSMLGGRPALAARGAAYASLAALSAGGGCRAAAPDPTAPGRTPACEGRQRHKQRGWRRRCLRTGGRQNPKPAAASLDALPGAVLPPNAAGRCQQSLSRCRRLQRAGRHEWGSALLCGSLAPSRLVRCAPAPAGQHAAAAHGLRGAHLCPARRRNPASPFLFSQNSQIVDVGEKGMAGRGHLVGAAALAARTQQPLAAPRLLLSPEHRSPSPLDRPSNLSAAKEARFAPPLRTCKLPSRPGGSCVPAMTTSDAGHRP